MTDQTPLASIPAHYQITRDGTVWVPADYARAGSDRWRKEYERVRDEKDAALVEIKRLRALSNARLDAVEAVVSQHPDPCERYADHDPIRCGWRQAVIDIRAALKQ